MTEIALMIFMCMSSMFDYAIYVLVQITKMINVHTKLYIFIFAIKFKINEVAHLNFIFI